MLLLLCSVKEIENIAAVLFPERFRPLGFLQERTTRKERCQETGLSQDQNGLDLAFCN